MERLSIEEKRKMVEQLLDPNRPLMKIANARGARRESGGAEYDSDTLLQGSRETASKRVARYKRAMSE